MADSIRTAPTGIAQILKEHRSTPQGSDRVCQIFPCDVRGAAVYRLKEGVPVADVCTRHKAQPPDKVRGYIGEDIAKDVRRHDHIVCLRVLEDIKTEGIDELLGIRYPGLLRLCDTEVAEEDIGFEHVCLVPDGELALPLLCKTG